MRLDEDDASAGNARLGSQGRSLPPAPAAQINPRARRKQLHHLEADVVPRRQVFAARIAQADDEPARAS